MDNYFTSLPLAAQLLASKTTMVGTIRKNMCELPKSIFTLTKREIYSSKFAY